jgi:DNA segregation ATPase FtsK/SpoIIIE-like protein
MKLAEGKSNFLKRGARDIQALNEKSGSLALPHILIVAFCEFFDVETEDSLASLAAQGVRTGIHTIIMVDRTSGSSLPNTIKGNVPARVAFRLTSPGESKAIALSGAEKLESGKLIYKPNFGSQEDLDAIFTPEINVKEVVGAVKDSTQ